MATVLRYKVFSALRNASRSCSLLKTKSPTNVRPLSSVPAELKENPLKIYEKMSIHQCLLIVEQKINYRGRLSNYELECIVQAMKVTESLQSNQILLLIRCCGSVAAIEKPEARMEYAKKVWNILKESRVELDITHYNAYLRVQIENEQQISYSEQLKTLKEAGVTPNRITYQNLITYCCQNGDLAGTTELLEEMKTESYPLNENIFNALILGHSVANDIKGAEGVIEIMKEKEIFITSKTYSMFLCGLAQSGHIEKMRSVMEECSKKNIEIQSSKLMDIVYYLFGNGHYDYGEELLKGLGEKMNFNGLATLQYRLLHKKNFEGYFRTLQFFGNEDMPQKMRLAFRYLGNKEDFETILKYKEMCDEKGLDVDPMRNILYYSLMNKSSGASLKIIENLHKTGHQLKETYFAPLLRRASEKGDLNEILQIIHTLSYNYGLELSLDFLGFHVFAHLNLTVDQASFLISGMKNHVTPVMVLNSFIKSCLKNDKGKILCNYFQRFRMPNRIYENVLIAMANFVNDQESAQVITKLLEKYNNHQRLDVDHNLPETEKSQTNIADKTQSESQEIIDKLAIKIFRRGDENITKIFLKEAEIRNIPISTGVLDRITRKSDDASVESLGDEVSERGLEIGEEGMSENKEFLDGKDNIETKFLKCKMEGDVTGMEKLLNENETLQTHFGFKKMVEQLRISNDDNLIKQYLQRFYEKSSQLPFLPKNFFLESEMIKRGMLKEAFELIGKRDALKASENFVISKIIATAFEKHNVDEIKQQLGITKFRDSKHINLERILGNLVERDLEELVINILRSLDEEDLMTVNLARTIIPSLISKKKVELIEELTQFIEKNFDNKKFLSELILLYACSGNIARGRELLDSDIIFNIRWLRCLSVINPGARMQVLENTVAILRGCKCYNKAELYEHLMKDYGLESANPEKALDLWSSSEEENIEATPTFLNELSMILTRNGRDVPFKVPEKSQERISQWSNIKDVLKAEPDINSVNIASFGLRKLCNSILEDELSQDQIKSCLKNNKNLNSATKEVLEKALYFSQMKNAFDNHTLADFLQKYFDDLDEKSYPFAYKFLARLVGLGLPRKYDLAKNISEILLWAHWKDNPQYEEVTKRLEPVVLENAKNERVLTFLVNTLEKGIKNRYYKEIAFSLLSNKMFDKHEDLKRRIEAINDLENFPPGKHSQVVEFPPDGDFSFRSALRVESQDSIHENLDPEKPEEKLESPDITEVEKRTPGSSQSL